MQQYQTKAQTIYSAEIKMIARGYYKPKRQIFSNSGKVDQFLREHNYQTH